MTVDPAALTMTAGVVLLAFAFFLIAWAVDSQCK